MMQEEWSKFADELDDVFSDLREENAKLRVLKEVAKDWDRIRTLLLEDNPDNRVLVSLAYCEVSQRLSDVLRMLEEKR